MSSKPFWKSKTLWANVGALIAAVGVYLNDGNSAALVPAVLALVNVGLRLITSQSLSGSA